MTRDITERKKALEKSLKFIKRGSLSCNAEREQSRKVRDVCTLQESFRREEIHHPAKTPPHFKIIKNRGSIPVENGETFKGEDKRQWIKAFCILLSLATLLLWVQQKTHLVIAASSSLPWKVFLVIKGLPWKKGDFVTFQGHTSPYIQGVPLITKRVSGLAGETIHYLGNALHINDIRIASPLQKNSRGKPLHLLKKNKISPGYVFVTGDDPKSFDSRYEEFGLVKVEHILGRSFPLW